MPVKLEWHTSLPILQTVCTGVLTANDYYAMCRQRSEALDRQAGPVVVVVNVQRLDAFPDAAVVKRCENLLVNSRIQRVMVVLPDDLYRRWSGTVVTSSGVLVRFYSSVDRALDDAEKQIAS